MHRNAQRQVYEIMAPRLYRTCRRYLKKEEEIEEALALEGLTLNSLVHAHLALARIVQEEGRLLAARHGFDYPVELETAALNYTMQELAAIGLVE